MRRFVALFAILVLLPFRVLAVASETSVSLNIPRTDKVSACSITIKQKQPIRMGDWIKISFPSNEIGSLKSTLPTGCDYSPTMHRRFNPTKDYLDKCMIKTSHLKLYRLKTINKTTSVEPLPGFEGDYIPGFLMPLMPIIDQTNKDLINAIIYSLARDISVMGNPCQILDGTSIVCGQAERSITIISPVDIDANTTAQGFSVDFTTEFGLVCPATAGSYDIEISTASNPNAQKTKVDVYTPAITNPDFTINPSYPDELSTWTFTFNTSPGGDLTAFGSKIFVRVPKGFGQKQKDTPWSFSINNASFDNRGNISIQEQESDELVIIPCKVRINAGDQVVLKLSHIMNPHTLGEVKCSIYTSSDTETVEFPPALITFTESGVSNPSEPSATGDLTIRFQTSGIMQGEPIMIVMPDGTKIDPNARVEFQGHKVLATLSEKTVQFTNPITVAKDSFVRIQISPITNPSTQNNTIKIKTFSKEFELPWNLKLFESKVTITCNPAIANSFAYWKFSILVPENLTPEERNLVVIEGPWNRALRPQFDQPIITIIGDRFFMSEFKDDKLSVKLLQTHLVPKALFEIEIPAMSKIGTPDKSGVFKITIGQVIIESTLILKDAPPAVAIKITDDIENQIFTNPDTGWYQKPVKLNLIASTPNAEISVLGIKEKITKKGDFFIDLKESYMGYIDVFAKDERGQGVIVENKVFVDIEPPKFTTKIPEITGKSPLEVDITIRVDAIEVSGGEKLIVYPAIDIKVVGSYKDSYPIETLLTENESEKEIKIKFTVPLTNGSNSIQIIATDQAGNTFELSQNINYEDIRPTLEFEQGISFIVKQGDFTIKAKTLPNATIKFLDKETKSTDDGSFTLNIVIKPGYNIFPVTITSQTGSQTAFDIAFIGKRTIKVKLNDLKMAVDTQVITLKIPPMNNFKSIKGIPSYYNGTTFVPLKDISIAQFAEVTFDDKTKIIKLVQKRPTHERIIEVKIGSPMAKVDGKDVPLSDKYLISPVIIKGTSMVPLRFISENLGSLVGFEKTTGSITIDWPDPKKAPGNDSGIKIP